MATDPDVASPAKPDATGTGWRKAISAFGIATAGVFTTLMVQHGPNLASSVYTVIAPDIGKGGNLPDDTDAQIVYPQIIQTYERDRNNKALLGSMGCMQSVMNVEWDQFIMGLFIRGVICENGNVLYQIADDPERSDRAMFRAVSGDWITLQYIDEVINAPKKQASAQAQPQGKMQPALFRPRQPGAGMTPIPVGQAAGAQLLCQRRLADGRGLFQRLRTPNGCIDQVIDTWTGRIIDSRPGPCQPC